MAKENSLVININGSAKNFLDELDKIKKETKTLEEVLSKTAKASAALFAGFAGAIAVVTKSFINYEKALVGVGKTTNIEGKRLQDFGKQFQKLASDIPVSTNELLGIAQAAGQLGIEGEANLLKFTETIAKLGVATDLTGEEAATSLARLLGLTKESVGTIDSLGSVLVALGNTSKATESEILKMALSVAKSTGVFGVSSGDAAALGTVLKELGQEAQLGGSVIGKSFLKIQAAIDKGGAPLKNLAALTGIAGDQLKQTFEEDATGVFRSFLSGIGNLEGGTSAIFKALKDFGLEGDEVNKILPVLAKNTDLLNKAFTTTGKEVSNATALNEEAKKAFATLDSQVIKVKNNFTNLSTNIGKQLAPQVAELLEGINGVAKKFSELDEETLSTIASFLKWGAVLSGGLAALSAFLLGAIKVSAIIGTIGGALLSTTVTASAFWIALTGPIGIAVAGVAALTAGFFALKSALSEKEPPQTLTSTTNELNKINEEIDALEARKGFLGGAEIVDLRNLKDARDELEKLREEKIKTDKEFGTGSLLLQADAEANLDPLKGLDEELTGPRLTESPLAPESDANEKEKQQLTEKQRLIDEATSKRIEAARLENEQLKQIQAERNAGATEEEIANLQRKQEIQDEFNALKKIKDDEERALALENLKLKHEEELNSIEEFEIAKEERAAERREEKAALDEELNQLSKEQRETLNQEEIDSLQTKIDTDQEAQKKAATNELNRKIAERNKFKQDEIKYGTEVAKLKQFFASQEVQGAKDAANQLVQLTNSKNSTLKGIGKAAARTQAAIKTAEGAISAYASLSGIPIVGPVLGGLAAASIISYGLEQQQKISAARTGGFVPPSSGGSIDRVPMMLEPNELVVPQALAPNFIQSVGQPQSGDFANEDVTSPNSGEKSLRLEGDLIQNEEFASALAAQIRDLIEFDNVRL